MILSLKRPVFGYQLVNRGQQLMFGDLPLFSNSDPESIASDISDTCDLSPPAITPKTLWTLSRLFMWGPVGINVTTTTKPFPGKVHSLLFEHFMLDRGVQSVKWIFKIEPVSNIQPTCGHHCMAPIEWFACFLTPSCIFWGYLSDTGCKDLRRNWRCVNKTWRRDLR